MADETLLRRQRNTAALPVRSSGAQPQQRIGTTRYNSAGQRMPGEFNERNQPIGHPEQNNLPMSKPYQPTDFNSVLKPRGNPLMQNQAGASAVPQLKPIGPTMSGTPLDGDTAVSPARSAQINHALRTSGVSLSPVPSAVQSQVTSTGRSAPNIRGERTLNVPGTGTPNGNFLREVNPREDRFQSFIPAGDALLPKGAAAGMIVDKKYRPSDGSAIASVSYGPTPKSRNGRIVDNGVDVTSQFMAPKTPPPSLTQVSPMAKAAAADIMRQTAKPKAEPFDAASFYMKSQGPSVAITTGQPSSAQFGGVSVPPADWRQAGYGVTQPVAAGETAPRTTTFLPPPASRPEVTFGPARGLALNDQTAVPAGQPLRTKSVGEALYRGNISEALAHINRADVAATQTIARKAYDATRGTAFEGSAADPVMKRYAGIQDKPAANIASAPAAAPTTPPPELVPQWYQAKYNPVQRVMDKYAPTPSSVKKATPMKNGSAAQVRYAANGH